MEWLFKKKKSFYCIKTSFSKILLKNVKLDRISNRINFTPELVGVFYPLNKTGDIKKKHTQ